MLPSIKLITLLSSARVAVGSDLPVTNHSLDHANFTEEAGLPKLAAKLCTFLKDNMVICVVSYLVWQEAW